VQRARPFGRRGERLRSKPRGAKAPRNPIPDPAVSAGDRGSPQSLRDIRRCL
jgi:hypothetical protein